MASATSAVKTAKPAHRLPPAEASTAQAIGAADRMLPSDETPTVSPASVPKIAAGSVRAKM
jgi:hypothetical protein